MGEISLQSAVLAAIGVAAMFGVSGLMGATLVSVAMGLSKFQKDEGE